MTINVISSHACRIQLKKDIVLSLPFLYCILTILQFLRCCSTLQMINSPLELLKSRISFVEVDKIAPAEVTKGRVLEYGDFNSDTRIDLAFVMEATEVGVHSSNTELINVHLWDLQKQQFLPTATFDSSCKYVSGLIAIDWNFDGKLDLIVVCMHQRTLNDVSSQLPQYPDNSYYFVAFIQDFHETCLFHLVWTSLQSNSIGHFSLLEKSINNYSTSTMNSSIDNILNANSNGTLVDYRCSSIHPLLADVNNDGVTDMIVQSCGNNKKRFVFLNIYQQNKFEPFNWEDFITYIERPSKYDPISIPHSSAFFDINGDCKSDLIFVVDCQMKGYEEQSQLEIWINGDEKYYKIDINPIILPAGSGQLAIADFNADGTMDLVIPVCDRSQSCNGCCTHNSRILMSPNIQKPMCSSIWKRGAPEDCRSSTELCKASDFLIPSFISQDIVEAKLDESDAKNFYGDLALPIIVRVGDFDGDGFPDLLSIVKDRNSDKPKVLILRNISAVANDNQNKLRKFEVFMFIDLNELNRGDASAYAASFFDFFDDGTLDIIVHEFSRQQESRKTLTRTYVQTSSSSLSDVLFLKATALNGVCTKACDTIPRFPDPVPYGVSAHGPTFKITVTDLNGIKTPRTATQLSQSAYTPLQPPFVLFGLGRTNNYVEEFYLGMPIRKVDHFNMWISIIPNSQVIAIPYKLSKSKEWMLELSVCPSKKFWMIMIVTIFWLVVVGFVIIVLDRKEKMEDSEEQKGFRSHFIVS